MKNFIILCVFLLCGFESFSDGYRNCMRPDPAKYSYGQNCNSSTQCITEFCNNSRCSCDTDSNYDPVSQFCVKKIGYDMLHYSDGDCGYISSSYAPATGLSNYWRIYGLYSDFYVTLILQEIDMLSSSCTNNYVEFLDVYNSILGKTCSRLNLPRFLASKSYYMFVIYLNNYSAYKGFRAMYYIRHKNSVITESTGYLASPGYPRSYSHNMNYTWHLAAKPGQIISLGILVELTHYSNDYVKIYDASNVTFLLRTFTGINSMQNITTTTNNMFIQFITQSSISYKGFSAFYDMYVLYGNSCGNYSDRCFPGLSCIDKVCSCTSSQYYDQTTKTCRSRLPYGSSCSSTDMCIQGFTCSSYACRCNSSQYYDSSYAICKTRVSHGNICSSFEGCVSGLTCSNGVCGCSTSQFYDLAKNYCSSKRSYGSSCTIQEECVSELVCYNSICRCPTSDYYTNSICKSGIPHGHTCTYQVTCAQGLFCTSGVCRCPSNQYFDQHSRICKNKLQYGSSCNSTEQCISGVGMACYTETCNCSSNQYYDFSYGSCRNRLSHGSTCSNSNQCSVGFICNGSYYCGCGINQYYDSTSASCRLQFPHGSTCTDTRQCLLPMICKKETFLNSACLCPTNMYSHNNTCHSDTELKAIISNNTVIKVHSVELHWITKARILNLTYNVTWKSSFYFDKLNYNTTRSSYMKIEGLSPNKVYNFTVSTIVPSDNYYSSKTVQSPMTIVTKLAHGDVCTSSGQCDEPMVCKKETINSLTCLCPSDMYIHNNVCYSDTDLQATMSSNTVIKDNSVELHWTTKARIPNLSYNVTWKLYGSIEDDTYSKLVTSNNITVNDLWYDQQFNFTIWTIVSTDKYYFRKAVQSVLTFVTKKPLGFNCTNNSQCSDEMTCDSGTCQCLSQYYSDIDRCVLRLNKGYYCDGKDICKETLWCIELYCQCSVGYYYDLIQQRCFKVRVEGENCDPSIDDMCEPDLECKPTYTNNYICVHDYEHGTYKSINDSSTTQTVLIAATVVGWLAAVAACILIYILCRRQRQKNAMKKEVDIQQTDISKRKSNQYKNFPKAQGQFSSLYLNSSEVTTSALNSSNANLTKPTSSTEPANQSAKPKTMPKPKTSTKLISTIFENEGYEVDLAEQNSKEESVYEEIGHVKNSVYGNVEECYANLNSLHKDPDRNSDI